MCWVHSQVLMSLKRSCQYQTFQSESMYWMILVLDMGRDQPREVTTCTAKKSVWEAGLYGYVVRVCGNCIKNYTSSSLLSDL